MDEMVVMESLDLEVLLASREREEGLELREFQAPAVGESPTSGGVEPPAPTPPELNWCTQAELLGLLMTHKEGQVTIFVYLIHLNIRLSDLVFRDTPQFMVPSIK